jgi:hypothetical protein
MHHAEHARSEHAPRTVATERGASFGRAARSIDRRAQSAAQRRLIESIHESPRLAAQRAMVDRIRRSPVMVTQAKRLGLMLNQGGEQKHAALGRPSPTRPDDVRTPSTSRGGLPQRLKKGIESLSGMAMDAVHVHYNSPKPAELQALAYTRGTDIYLGPGQDEHLPHEAWHVVQQAQGRVQPTTQMKGGVAGNDDLDLEHEADVMGSRALRRVREVLGHAPRCRGAREHAGGMEGRRSARQRHLGSDAFTGATVQPGHARGLRTRVRAVAVRPPLGLVNRLAGRARRCETLA